MSSGSPSFETVWEDAYKRLETEQPELLTAYEEGILEETRAKCRDSRTKQLEPLGARSTPARRQQQLQLVLTIQFEYIEERQLIIHVGKRDLKVRDCVRKTVKAIDAAKGFIATAASNEPHAALAWAGVSCLLPLILNASTSDDDAIEGLDYVQDMLSRYRVVQRVLMENKILNPGTSQDSIQQRVRLRAHVVELYLQTLVYQFALVKQFSHGKAKQVMRNVFRKDNWKQKLADVKATEQECESHRKVLETETQALISQELLSHGNKLDHLIQNSEDQKARQEALDERAKLEGWLSAMYPSDMDSLHMVLRNQLPPKMLGKSGTWFVKQVKDWLNEDKDMVYWGRGDPGVGKSMLIYDYRSEAVDAIGHSLEDYNFDAYAFTYLQWDKQHQQTPTAVLANILSKLCSASASLTAALLKLCNTSRETHIAPSAMDLQSVLTAHGRHSDDDDDEKTQARFLILIDGLDEAETDTRIALVRCINALNPRYFRVIITSRKDLTVTTTAAWTTEFNIQADSKDLVMFVYAELGRIELAASVLENKTDTRKWLASRGDGMFLLVKHHTHHVGNQTTVPKMKEAATKPFALDAVYDEMLKHVELDEQFSEDAIKALCWLAYARQTFTAGLLTEALAITPGDAEFNAQNIIDVKQVARLCRGLVVHDTESDTIRLAHQTVKDYLRQLDTIAQLEPVICATCFTALALERRTSRHDEDCSRPVTVGINRAGTDDVLAQLAESDLDLEAETSGIDNVAKGMGSKTPTSPLLPNDAPDDVTDQMEMVPGFFHAWADGTTEFTIYAGTFALEHFVSTDKRPDFVVEALWNFLSKRPAAGMLRSLTRGRNKYPHGHTPLDVATWLGHLPTISRLVDEGVNVNVTDSRRRTPLMAAAAWAVPETIVHLLSLGADPEVVAVHGQVALEMLQCDVDEETVRLLLPKDHGFREDILFNFAERGFYNCVKVFLELGIGDAHGTYGPKCRSPSHIASERGHTHVVDLLCQHGCNVNATDSDGDTPLHLAVDSGTPKLLDRLLRAGADLNLVDNRNEHALLRAAWGGHWPDHHLAEDVMEEMFESLLDYDVDLEIKARNGGTALWEAQEYSRAIQKLIEAGCNLHTERAGITTFQNLAIHSPDSRSYDVLYAAEQRLAKREGRQFTVLVPNSEGDTSLHLTAGGKNLRPVEKLLYIEGVDVNIRNRAGQTPLFKAMHLHGEQIAQRLLTEGAETDIIDHRGNSILDAAITAATPKMIGRILQGSCSIEAPHWTVDTPQVQQLGNEPWFQKLADLIAKRNERTSSLVDLPHTRVALEDPVMVRDSDKPKDKCILRLVVPDHLGNVREVTFYMEGRDQGHSWKQREYGGTYSFACSLFETGIRKQGRGKLESVRPVQKNLHADGEARPYTISWNRESKHPKERDWVRSLEPGDKIVLRAQAHGSGWQNRVRAASIDIWGDGKQW
ncbi:uncharacterized protein LTR77_000872 [Saxophila tyrrhenica]|uniref:NWD NACHT-NTPase N-terminal domain-containing protein n=1 Tax=Saxophila tyrrhenica TaxID=1690608 RepID=A0AAV9PTT3_9PEZI|nr:hypothetical protein LTR77_000872 [Saxophila tyrrhenica]